MSDAKNSELPAERVLFEGHAKAVVVQLAENERPPLGLAGILDWYFQGQISKMLRLGSVSGKKGECAYLPVVKNGVLYQLFLAGGGPSDAPGARGALPSETLQKLNRNLVGLKLPKVILSKGDLGDLSPEALQRQFKGVSSWIAP